MWLHCNFYRETDPERITYILRRLEVTTTLDETLQRLCNCSHLSWERGLPAEYMKYTFKVPELAPTVQVKQGINPLLTSFLSTSWYLYRI